MDRPTVIERLRYSFDTWMSRGTIALMALLGLVTLAFVVAFGAAAWLILLILPDGDSPDPELGLLDFIWQSLMRTLDPGTMGGDQGWAYRLLMLVVTIGGLIIVANLIALISGAFDAKVLELRKGRSRVLEHDHTLILGWNSKVVPIIREIAIANESRGRAHIVVLAQRDKVEMEDEIRAHAGALGRTSVICRTGDPKSPQDVAIASPQTARSIILLASDDAVDADAEVIKTALALMRGAHGAKGERHIVGELADPASLPVARIVGGSQVHWVVGPEVIGRIAVQSCRQSGLSAVYRELLDFDGDEIYVTDQPALAGSSYFDAQRCFEDATVIGLIRRGEVLLNPPAQARVEAGDRVVLIAEDDSTIRLGSPCAVSEAGVVERAAPPASPEHTLILGASPGLGLMLVELDQYVAPGSSALVVADRKAPPLPELQRLEVGWQRGDPTRRAVLDKLGIEAFDHIVVLADAPDRDAQSADSRTLVTLLQLRDMAVGGGRSLNIVSEMLDDANRELAEVTEADDFIVSDRLVALVLAQLAGARELAAVFDILFTSEGPEISLMPAEDYVQLGVEVDATALLRSASLRGETALGYRVAALAHDSGEAYGVRVNPRKSERMTFQPGDRVIVLGESQALDHAAQGRAG